MCDDVVEGEHQRDRRGDDEGEVHRDGHEVDEVHGRPRPPADDQVAGPEQHDEEDQQVAADRRPTLRCRRRTGRSPGRRSSPGPTAGPACRAVRRRTWRPPARAAAGSASVMNSAWAMLVWGMALKNTVMFSPKQSPTGIIIFHVASDGGRTPVCDLAQAQHHPPQHGRQQQPPERDRRAGHAGPLDDRGAAGEAEDAAEDAEDADESPVPAAPGHGCPGSRRRMSGSM